MLAIAILAGIAYIFSIIDNVKTDDSLSVNPFIATILVVSTLSCLPLAIVIMSITAAIYILGALINH